MQPLIGRLKTNSGQNLGLGAMPTPLILSKYRLDCLKGRYRFIAQPLIFYAIDLRQFEGNIYINRLVN